MLQLVDGIVTTDSTRPAVLWSVHELAGLPKSRAGVQLQALLVGHACTYMSSLAVWIAALLTSLASQTLDHVRRHYFG